MSIINHFALGEVVIYLFMANVLQTHKEDNDSKYECDWFVNRWLVPLSNDPKSGQLMQTTDWTSMHLGALKLVNSFVIPYWYLIAIVIATAAYYVAFRKHDMIVAKA